MHFSTSSLVTIASVASTAYAHGVITSPWPRALGPATLAACGSAITEIIQADNTTHVEGLPEAGATDQAYNATACDLWLCRGQQFADSTDIQTWAAGQVVPLEVWIRIPHEGTANVSIVDTKTNTIIGKPLIYWDRYADENLKTLPLNNTNFEVTIPDLAGKCATAGDCVLQWWWYGTAAKQTYESCVDFTQAPAAATYRNRFNRA